MAMLRLFGLYFMLTLLMIIVGSVAGAYFGDPFSGMIFFLVFAIAINFFSYFYSDKLVLRAYGAKIIERQDNRRLYDMVKKIADINALPMPRIAIVSSSTPNAFATGRNPKNAVVAATTGIMSILDDNELEGVMAHEMAHVKNRDTLVMCAAATIAGAIAFAARMLWWNSMFSGGRNRNVHPVLLILVALTAPLAAFLLQMAVSRSREFHADATAAKLTNKPWALISALKKLEWENHRKPLDCGSPSYAAMCIVNPLRGGDFFINMFSTHPPMEKRINELEKL